MGANKLSHAEFLQTAFADFERASNELGEFYQNLEQRVTQLTHALAAAKSSEIHHLKEKERLAARLRSLLDALPAGIVELAADGLVIEFNPAAKCLLGDIEIGDCWVDIVQRAFRPRWDDGHDVSLADGRRVNIETAALDITPGQILLIKDVTETRHLQERVSHHQRISAKTEVAAGLAHQVRTPLSTAILYLTNLSVPTLSDSQRRNVVKKSLASMRDIEKLVADMLSFARAGTFEMEPLELSDFMQSFVRKLHTNTYPANFQVQLQPLAPNTTIRGNRDALISIMTNLIENSAAAGASKLTISICSAVDQTKIEFLDDGPGITQAIRENLFEPFYSTKASGNGLGLAVARSVSRAHSGELYLDESVVEGACFVLMLPTVAVDDQTLSEKPDLLAEI